LTDWIAYDTFIPVFKAWSFILIAGLIAIAVAILILTAKVNLTERIILALIGTLEIFVAVMAYFKWRKYDAPKNSLNS